MPTSTTSDDTPDAGQELITSDELSRRVHELLSKHPAIIPLFTGLCARLEAIADDKDAIKVAAEILRFSREHPTLALTLAILGEQR